MTLDELTEQRKAVAARWRAENQDILVMRPDIQGFTVVEERDYTCSICKDIGLVPMENWLDNPPAGMSRPCSCGQYSK